MPSTESFGDGGLEPQDGNTCDGSDVLKSPMKKMPSTEVQQPSVGDIIITEIFADPIGVSDKLGEWIEITNITQIP